MRHDTVTSGGVNWRLFAPHSVADSYVRQTKTWHAVRRGTNDGERVISQQGSWGWGWPVAWVVDDIWTGLGAHSAACRVLLQPAGMRGPE